MSTRLILIRHGETDWNRQRRYCGFSDIDLNQNGKKQGELLGQRLKKEKIDKVYSSGMKRTDNFAAIALGPVTVEKIFGLREVNFGSLEGLTYQEVMKKLPLIYGKWLDNPLANQIPDAESLSCFAARVRQALAKILSDNKGSSSAVFSHAGPLRIILADSLKIELKDIWQIKQDSANINIIEFVEEKSKIVLQNNITYLHE